MNPFERAMRGIGSAMWFFRKGLLDFDTTANVVPSSRYLVKAMLEPISHGSVECVLELGSGTGTLTREILKRIGPDAHVHMIEIDEKMLAASVKLLSDPRARPHLGSAADARELIGPECAGRVDAVVSSLGLAAMERRLRRCIQRGIQDVLAPDGVYTQYAYPHAKALTISFARREIYRFDAGAFVRRYWSNVVDEFVPVNVPPAYVYTCRGPTLVAPVARRSDAGVCS